MILLSVARHGCRVCPLFLVLVVLAGCTSPTPKPRPPRPRITASTAARTFSKDLPVPKDATAVQLRLLWDYPADELPGVYFVIHGSPTPEGPWSVTGYVTNVTEWRFVSEHAGFFWNEAIDLHSGLSSGPNR